MSVLNKLYLITAITTASMSAAIACPVSIIIGTPSLGGYSGVLLDNGSAIHYQIAGDNSGSIVKVEPGDGSPAFIINCNDNPGDCNAAWREGNDGHTPHPPSSAEPVVPGGNPPAESEEPDQDAEAQSSPQIGTEAWEKFIFSAAKRSEIMISNECSDFKETVKNVLWDTAKREYYKTMKYRK